MKVLFLDFDGVAHPLGVGSEFQPHIIIRLNRILMEGEVTHLVVSSTWRHIAGGTDEWLKQTLDEAHVALEDRWAGATPRSRFCCWGAIEEWLKERPRCTFVILDDMKAPRALQAHAVHVDGALGLTEGDVAKALRILS
jgi:hypothetical protein